MTIKSMNIQELAAKKELSYSITTSPVRPAQMKKCKFFDLSSPAMSLSRAQMPLPWKALFSMSTGMGTALPRLALVQEKCHRGWNEQGCRKPR